MSSTALAPTYLVGTHLPGHNLDHLVACRDLADARSAFVQTVLSFGEPEWTEERLHRAVTNFFADKKVLLVHRVTDPDPRGRAIVQLLVIA